MKVYNEVYVPAGTNVSAEIWFKKAKALGFTVIDKGEFFLAETTDPYIIASLGSNVAGEYYKDLRPCWLYRREVD